MALENKEKFDLQLVHNHFSSALYDDDDIYLDAYLKSFEELNKFFTLMGSVFGFVSSDLKAKVDVLADFLSNESVSDNFQTVKKMIEYEKENKLLDKNDYTSGSRTLLRLHRGLDFIREFLHKVGELDDKDLTAPVCRQAYDKTLAKHHSFFIKSGARIAMHILPTRENLLKKVCGGEEEEVKRTLEILPQTLQTTTMVYERIDNIYAIHNLHSLP